MSRHSNIRRAFSLIEAVVVVVSLAISVPPAVMWLNQSTERRADAVNTIRATMLATMVMESVLADSASDAPGLGFGVFADSAAYLDTPVTGLRARLAGGVDGYMASGLRYEVQIGPLVDSSGRVNDDASRNLFRLVTVTVTYPSMSGGELVISIDSMVTRL